VKKLVAIAILICVAAAFSCVIDNVKVPSHVKLNDDVWVIYEKYVGMTNGIPIKNVVYIKKPWRFK
jgi:hypothetical protein